MIAYIDDNTGQLWDKGEFGMSVLPKWRGQGIGSLLLSNLLAWARSNPAIEKVNLRVISNNEAGLSLYRKLGFKEEGRKLKKVKYGNNEYADDIHMGLFV